LLCGSCTNKTLNKSLEFGAANEESFRFDFLQERPDVAMRFLREDPWQRLQQLRAAVPNVLLQMLLRSSNAVDYTNYADNVVRYFVQQAAQQGVDLFRVFDSLNWVDNMRVAIDAVLETGMLCEGAICYTADIHDRTRKYDLASYLKLARELKAAGVHILGLKDMSGVCRPQAARELVHALRHETGLPVHFHTHDTSGISAASVLAAIEAGCDAVDCALDSMSGLTSQPNLGAIVPALEGGPRDPCAGAHGRAAWSANRWRPCLTISKGCARSTRRSNPTFALARQMGIGTRCPAANTPTCANRRVPPAWNIAGPRCRAPARMAIACSAMSSRCRRPPRWWATWRCSWWPTTCRRPT